MVSRLLPIHRGRSLRHSEILQGVRQGAGDLIEVHGKASLAADLGVDGVSRHFALLLGRDRLLFEERGKQFIRVLNRAQSERAAKEDCR